MQTLTLSKTEVEGLRKIQFIQDKFHQAVHRSLAKVIFSFTKRLNKLSRLKARLQRPLGLVRNELEMAAKDPTYLREVARRMASQQAQDDVFNVTLLGQVYINGEITDEQAKFKLNEKREALEKLVEEIDKQQGQLLAFQQAFLRKKMK